MNKLYVLAVFLAGAATCASTFGADLPSNKAPPTLPAIAPAPSWTGPYLGAFAGYGWANPSGGYALSSATLEALPPIIPVIDATGSHSLEVSGGLIGGEAGYNWQASRLFVLGAEGDLAWSGLSGSHVVPGTVPNFGIPYTIAQSLRADWQASLRLRAGLTPIDRLLVYVTAGPAIADLDYSSAFWDPVPETESKSFSSVRAGWALGGGAEYALSANWSFKAEYLYSQFSAAKGTGSGILTDGTTAYIAHSSGTLRENLLRLGVNYRFE